MWVEQAKEDEEMDSWRGEGGRAAYATHWLPQGHRFDAHNFPVLGEIVMSVIDSHKEVHMANEVGRPKETAL